MHDHNNGHVGHFRWCPARIESATFSVCFCEIIIYLTVAVIGGVGFYFEYTMGNLAHSYAPQADAWHLAADTAGTVVVGIISAIVAFSSLTRQEPVRVCGVYLQGIFLLIAAVLIGNEVFERFASHEPINALTMVGAASIGIGTDAFRFALLLGLKQVRGENINFRAEWRHVLSDLIHSLFACVAGILTFFTGSRIWDTGAVVIIFVLIVYWAFETFCEAYQRKIYNH